jgi:hypothetical protein
MGRIGDGQPNFFRRVAQVSGEDEGPLIAIFLDVRTVGGASFE